MTSAATRLGRVRVGVGVKVKRLPAASSFSMSLATLEKIAAYRHAPTTCVHIEKMYSAVVRGTGLSP